MELHIQDPLFSAAYTLHEALVEAGRKAEKAYATYAFVTKGGVELLLGDVAFQSVIRRGGLKLIVGMDSITNEAALALLNEYCEEFEGLHVLAFMHDDVGSLYHPKMMILATDDGGVVINGSGNLTVGGLRKNREVFTVSPVPQEDFERLLEHWEKWETENRKNLFTIDSDEVKVRAKENTLELSKAAAKRKSKVVAEDVGVLLAVQDDDAEGELAEGDEEWLFTSTAEVLIAEIPKSSTRWKQANFNEETYVNFFGGSRVTSSKSIVLRSVLPNGELGEIERRPCVASKSKNYRVELEAAAGLEYPEEGRPIGVFVKLSARMFLYFLCMPGDNAHGDLLGFLNQHVGFVANKMRRMRKLQPEMTEVLSCTALDKYFH